MADIERQARAPNITSLFRTGNKPPSPIERMTRARLNVDEMTIDGINTP